MAESRQISGVGSSVSEELRAHPLTMLLRVEQSGGRAPPVGGFSERVIYERVKELGGVDPLSVTVVSDREAVLEFEDQTPIVQLAQRIHGTNRWEGQTAELACLLSSRNTVMDVIKVREEGRVEKEKMHKEQDEYRAQIASLLERVNHQMERVESFQRGGLQSGPSIPSGIETPREVESVTVKTTGKLNKAPNLPFFSGIEPTPSNEGSLEQWVFQIEGALSTHTEEAVRSALIGSVRGPAREYLEFIGYRENLPSIIRSFRERFRQNPSKAKLQKEYYVMEQRKNENINQFAGRVEHKFKLLQQEYPGRFDRDELKERVYQGMLPHLRDSMRFMYLQPQTSYEEFIAAVQQAEAESGESKPTSVRAKSVSASETEMGEIRKKLDSITAVIKSLGSKAGNVSKGSKYRDYKKKKNDKMQKQQVEEEEEELCDHLQFVKDQLGLTSVDADEWDKKLQCWNCGGWGHRKRDCPTPENYLWGVWDRGTGSPGKKGPENKK